MIDFFKKTFNILKSGFLNRIIPNTFAMICLGVSVGITIFAVKIILTILGVMVIAETWYQFGYTRATVLSALKAK